jgi:Raf kinase inhibitor-like YbhB/YbcL family protein
VPAGTRSLALIVDDPDAPDPAAPKRTWVHWVVCNIPATATGITSDAKPLPAGAECGLNDWGRPDYGGPCPPVGKHRYFFKLYALDTLFGSVSGWTKSDVEAAMAGHILDKAELMGTYEKKHR